MPKKRKAASSGAQPNPDAADTSKRFKMTVDSWRDVANSEDEWDLNRDEILLEGEESRRKRARRGRDEEGESEVEVLDVPDEDEDEEGDEEEGDERDGEEEEEGWGAGDAYGADEAQNEEDAREIEAEALRLQKKRLAAMSEADFGFDEEEWMGGRDEGGDVEGEGDGSKHVEKLPELEITPQMTPVERERVLKARYPEFELLAKEFLGLQRVEGEMREGAEKAMRRFEGRRERARAEDGDGEVEVEMPAVVVRYNALAGYLGTLAMYFAVFTSTVEDEEMGTHKPIDPKELREHSIMDALVKGRALWEKVRDLELGEEDQTVDEETSDAEDLSDSAAFYTPKQSPIEKPQSKPSKTTTLVSTKSRKPTRAEKLALKARADAEALRASQLAKLDEDIAALNSQNKTLKNLSSATTTNKASAKSKASADVSDTSDFGDETALTSHEAREKAKRKKTLRFYTSQIAQKVNKREAAASNTGGDADLPYRERLRDRIARLNAEAEARGKNKKHALAGEALGDDSSDEADRALAADVRSDAEDDSDGDDGYYQQISSKTSKKKSEDKSRREAQKEAAVRGQRVIEVETLGEDGKRAVGYVIEKNKGLTPHRKKSVRNPRKKKREAFEKKSKKLGSVRQVWKGGEGRGGYGGELTGIKKGVVRGVKL